MKYENPAATADVIIENEKQEVLLIQRKDEPFKNMWALPGGHIELGKETVEQAGSREALEETSIKVAPSDLELIAVYSEPDRDPRGHYITHVYVAKRFSGTPKAADDAKDVRYFSKNNLPPLAFDHDKIIKHYMRRQNNEIQ